MGRLRTAAGILRTASFVGARRFSSTSLLLCAPAALRRLSTVSSTPQLSSDSELLSLLDKAIKRAADDLLLISIARAPLYFPFMIHDGSGWQIIRLTWEYEDEHIEVRVKIPDFTNGQEEAEDEYGEGVEDSEDENHEEESEDDENEVLKAVRTTVAMVVTVSMGSGSNLTFSCTVYPDEIVINDVTARFADANDVEMCYVGPKFEDMGEKLQKGFLKYLEMRGITPSTAHFLFDYMVKKDKKEYHLWLTKVKDFMRR